MPVRPVDRSVFDRDVTMVDPIDLLLGGDAMNESITLTRLGNKVGLVGRIGDDTFGKMLLDLVGQEGVDASNIKVVKGSRTSACAMLINQNGDRNFASHRGANSELCLNDIDLSLLKKTKLINFGSLLAMKSLDGAGTEAILKEAKANGVITSADMMADTYKLGFVGIKGTLSLLDYFIPSYGEASDLTKEKDLDKIADVLLNLDVKNVIIKLGPKGCFVKNAKENFTLETFDGPVVDTTGAGDNFVAGFLTGVLKGWDLKQCATFANAVGTITVAQVGPTGAVKNMEQVLDFIKINKK
jgi:sugar/nucleoside kinase (ribokinase family)